MTTPAETPNRVTVTDIDMPIVSMISFMIKLAIAAIPAVFIVGAAWVVMGVAVSSAISAIHSAISGGPAPEQASTPVTAKPPSYSSKIEVGPPSVSRDVMGGDSVFGEIKNIGDKVATKVELTIYCLDVSGKPIFERAYSPVYEGSFDADSSPPLKPGYSRKFGVRMKDAPATWNKTVTVKVTSVETAP